LADILYDFLPFGVHADSDTIPMDKLPFLPFRYTAVSISNQSSPSRTIPNLYSPFIKDDDYVGSPLSIHHAQEEMLEDGPLLTATDMLCSRFMVDRAELTAARNTLASAHADIDSDASTISLGSNTDLDLFCELESSSSSNSDSGYTISKPAQPAIYNPDDVFESSGEESDGSSYSGVSDEDGIPVSAGRGRRREANIRRARSIPSSS